MKAKAKTTTHSANGTAVKSEQKHITAEEFVTAPRGRRSGLTQDAGNSGLQVNGWGQIRDDFLPEWRSTAEKVRRVDEMLANSPIVAALRMAVEMPIRAIKWEFSSDEGDDDPRLELLNAARDNLSHSWNDHVVEALLFPFYGWSLFTITYEPVDGRLLWRKFKLLGHDTIERWLFEEDDGLKGVKQYGHLWAEPIPIERCLLYRFRRTRNNPEGNSILRPAWIPWYYVKNIQQIEAIGIERNLAGLPVVTPPMHADMSQGSEDYNAAHAIVRNVRQDEQAGVVLPPPAGEGDHMKWHFDLASGSGMSKIVDTDIVINRYEKRMLMAALAQFLMLGQDNVGSLSLSQDQTDFFTMAVNAVADIIAETNTKFAVVRLLELNGMDTAGIRLEHSPAGDIDINVLSSTLQTVANLITWDESDEVWLRNVLRLPEKSVEEIAAVKEEKERRAAEIQAVMARGQEERGERPGGDEDEGMEDNMVASGGPVAVYEASGAPDKADRDKAERLWYRTAKAFFDGQYKRIVKGARGVKR